MHEDDELKAQCFGGDYMGEVFDSNLKRMQFRKQKRWWNAYMLFYTRCDQKFNHKESVKEQLSLAESRHCILPMPEPIERSVRIQNIRFLHSRSIFTNEFFGFIRRLVHASAPTRIDKLVSRMSIHFLSWTLKSNQLKIQYNFFSYEISVATNGRVIIVRSSISLTLPISYWVPYEENAARCFYWMVSTFNPLRLFL